MREAAVWRVLRRWLVYRGRHLPLHLLLHLLLLLLEPDHALLYGCTHA